MPYTEAVDILQKSGQTFEFPVAWGNDLQAEHERYLTEKHFKSPVILYDYPRTLKPFYMRVNDDGKTVRAMDVLVPGVGEIIGGSQREERLDVLEERMKEQGLEPGGVLVVPRPAPLRHGAARRLRPGPGADGAVPDRHGEHPRRDPVPAHAGECGVLRVDKRPSLVTLIYDIPFSLLAFSLAMVESGRLDEDRTLGAAVAAWPDWRHIALGNVSA